ncbi:MAG: DUF1800 domain-containing protein [Pseudomonadota bacterium]
MRHALTASLCLSLTTLPQLSMAGPDAMTAEEARHLIARTGFGASPAEIAQMTGLSYADGVDQILGSIRTDPINPMPTWVDAWYYPYDQIWTLSETQTDLFFNNRWMEIEELQQWWLREMVETPSPLTEKLVLFWHDHFATDAGEHESPQWAAQQNRLFRAHAAGNFTDLAGGILQEPAMLVYLTNTENDREAPNENLGREFLELFTLGEGRGYTQDDVVATARALTGYTINDFADGSFVFDREMHDDGPKTILGQTGRFDATDLPGIVTNDPNFGPYIVEKLWQTFVSDTPHPDEVARLAVIWRTANWEMAPLLRAMFLSDAFWDPANRGTIVKNPVDLMVGAIRTLGVAVPYAGDLAWAVDDLGQPLFFPPNVGGWPQGTGWITDATASGRATMLTYLVEYDPEPREEMAGAMMMMQTATAPSAQTDSTDDLSIGQVFALEAERIEDDRGLLTLTLFDVSFKGDRWRSVSFVADVGGPDDFEIAMQISDCAPACFPNWPFADDDPYGWIWFHSDDIAEGEIDWMTATDKRLVAAIMGHLPALVRATQDQRVWQTGPYDDGTPLTVAEVLDGSEWLVDFAAAHLDTPRGAARIAPVPPATVGLGGIDTTTLSDDEIEDIYDMQERALNRPITPAVTYDNAADWLAAIPGTAFDSARAEATLLALPRPAEGRRMEKVASDPEALVRALILSPYFQLN